MKSTQEELLKRIIERAVKNGFDMATLPDGGAVQLRGPHTYRDSFSVEALIFNHDFAKAYWPNSAGIVQYNENDEGLGFLVYGNWAGKCEDCGKLFKGKKEIENIRFGHKDCPVGHEIWQHYLSELALTPEDERINYLAKFLK